MAACSYSGYTLLEWTGVSETWTWHRPSAVLALFAPLHFAMSSIVEHLFFCAPKQVLVRFAQRVGARQYDLRGDLGLLRPIMIETLVRWLGSSPEHNCVPLMTQAASAMASLALNRSAPSCSFSHSPPTARRPRSPQMAAES